jgi:hypothetical protein
MTCITRDAHTLNEHGQCDECRLQVQTDYYLTINEDGQASLWDNPQPGSEAMRLVQQDGRYYLVPNT